MAQREVWNLISLCPHVAETTWADQVPSSSLLKHLAGPHFPVSLSLDWTYDRILASGTGVLTVWLLPDQTLEFIPQAPFIFCKKAKLLSFHDCQLNKTHWGTRTESLCGAESLPIPTCSGCEATSEKYTFIVKPLMFRVFLFQQLVSLST